MTPAKINSQRYEYDMAVIRDTNTGATDLKTISQTLQAKSREGWRLVTVFTNELGVNSHTTWNTTYNATIDETVLVFEREIRQPEAPPLRIVANITESNVTNPIVAKTAVFTELSGRMHVQLNVFAFSSLQLQGLQGDLEVFNVFGDSYMLEGISFFSFEDSGNGYLVSSPFPVTLPDMISRGVANATLKIKRYIGSEGLVTPTESMSKVSLSKDGGKAQNNGFDKMAFMAEVLAKNNAKEIYEHVLVAQGMYPGVFTPDITEMLKGRAELERMYGNEKGGAANLVKIFLDTGSCRVHVDRSQSTFKCPICGATMRSDRKNCFKCGALYD